MARTEYLSVPEREFLIFHLTPPPAREWRWIPVDQPSSLILRAFKDGPDGELTADVEATSYRRLSQFFDENFQVNLEALAALEVRVTDVIDL